LLDAIPTSTPASRHLPTRVRPGWIPVNAAGYRLDISVDPPTKAQWNKYHARTQQKKLCNAQHLRGSCNAEDCEFDHAAIDAEVRMCLYYILLELPCRHKGACHRLDCYNGHVCQKEACGRGKIGICKFAQAVHKQDLSVARWIKPSAESVKNIQVKTASESENNNSKSAMENWPMMVGDLIDI
jgi:hypothetical protein